jgi:hypothetical protein
MRFLATLSPGATVIAADYFGPIVRGQLGIVTGCRRGTWLPWQRTAYVCTFLGGVMALPQPIIAKRELLAAMVLDGQVVDVDVVMQGIDEWLAAEPQNAWHKRQHTWEIEPWLELLPFSTRPGDVIEGLTKVKAFKVQTGPNTGSTCLRL